MKNQVRFLSLVLLLIMLTACSPQPAIPTATPTPIIVSTPTFLATIVAAATTIAPPTATFIPTLTTIPPVATKPVWSGTPSGPYGVILVADTDVLNIRSGPGVGNLIVSSFPATYTDVMRTGPSTMVEGSLWVEVNPITGGKGWVNSEYLSEYITSSAFCADGRVQTLLQDFEDALRVSNGEFLASLVSPEHGMDVWLWNGGNAINFDAEHARWVFESTYVHNWGAHPASGLETSGTFRESVLPELQDAFVPSAQLRCNDPAISSYGVTWPAQYANVNFYQVFRPGSPGVELDWNAWLVGVEYVDGDPYLFALIHFIWTP